MKVLAGGTFNILHPGHIYFLRKAKELGDELVVVVSTDKRVKKEKGRLILPSSERKKIIESLRFVDRVIIGSNSDFFNVVEKERPDIIVLGYDQEIDRKELSKRLKKIGHKCSIIRIEEKHRGYSTRKILERIGIS